MINPTEAFIKRTTLKHYSDQQLRQCLPRYLTNNDEQTIVTPSVSIVDQPIADLQPARLRWGLGSQIASLASGITGLLGVTDASVTTASFRLSICPLGQSHVARPPGVLRNRAHMEGRGAYAPALLWGAEITKM